ncbi:MAG: BrnT family toxin [Candidatus Sedimenticola sp. 6PFRAG5]
MRIDWDENKNRLNKANHQVSFETAQHVFDDPHHLSVQDRHVDGEERWQTLGSIGGVVVLLVAHTHRETGQGEVIRIISARKATKHERKRYEEGR